MMLILDEKLMILKHLWGPHVFSKRVCLHFFCRFFDLKIVSDDFDVKDMNCDFGPSRLSVKKRVFSVS